MISSPAAMIGMGFVLGALGTMIGSGGGFLLVPALLLLDPEIAPPVVTGISLAVVFFNAASGSIAYARMGRINYRAGCVFAIAALPGAVLGASATSLIPRQVFDVLFGSLLIIASAYLVISSGAKTEEKETKPPNLGLGALISIAVGFLSSFLGIGGGIIHVPALTHMLNFPVHAATATSHFVLAITTLAATIVHTWNGTLNGQFRTILWLSIGAVAGAQIGAKLSRLVKGSWILRALAAGLGVVGLRILLRLF